MSYKLEQISPSDPIFIYKDNNQIAVMMPEDFDHIEKAAYHADKTYKAIYDYGLKLGHYGAYKHDVTTDLARKMVLISSELNAIHQILEDMQMQSAISNYFEEAFEEAGNETA